MAEILDLALKNAAVIAAAEAIAPGRTVRLSGLWGSAACLAGAALGRLRNAPVLFITRHLDEADELADDVEVLTGRRAHLFPAWEVDLPHAARPGEHINDEVTGERLRLCNLLSQTAASRDEPVEIVVAPVMAILQPAPSPQALAAGKLTLAKGASFEVDALIQWLVDAGFEHVEQVDQQGEFAHRGGIVDIFPLGVSQALRVEFFGDQIDSIRRFDLDSQRSTDSLDAYDLTGVAAVGAAAGAGSANLLDYLPADAIVCIIEPREVMDLAGELYRRVTEEASFRPEPPLAVADDDSETPIAKTQENEALGSEGKMPSPLAGETPATPLQLPAGASPVFLHSPEDVFLGLSKFALVELHVFAPKTDGTMGVPPVEGDGKMGVSPVEIPDIEEGDRRDAYRTGDRRDAYRTGDRRDAYRTGDRRDAYRTGDRRDAYRTGDRRDAYRTGDRRDAYRTGGIFDLGVSSLQKISLNTHEALMELEELSEHNQIWIYCENTAEQNRFREVLHAEQPALAVRVRTGIGHVSGGFFWPERKLVVVGHSEVFHRYSKVRRIRTIRAGRPIESLLDLREGDYVVHVGHGIAKFEGLRTMEQNGRTEEYLRLRFADNAVLSVPASSINLVQKYIGSRGKRPALSRLGGSQWSRQKQKVREAVHDLAAEMLRVQAMRQGMVGLSYPPDTPWQRQFAGEFLYTETEDQILSMRQIDGDMAEPRPMDRLLCGDVGYGKTELAMRAAFRVAEAGKQVAVLVPTTVLADQHYRTFCERLADYPIRIDVISRFRNASEQAQIIKKLALGQIDILIGTHRLVSKDVAWSDLGLVIIDEEQRFGVRHKEHLKNLRASVDVLTMTATPIPRTMHMALLGLRDISNLTTPPLDRRSIHTEVVAYDEALVRSAILRELNREGQTFFVHNRVSDIHGLAGRIRQLVPEARVAVGHGQMSEGELEKTMLRFVRHEVDVLVCTTIIESGLDIPTANTILIHNADRFGLAELHQLRGRVGRYKHRAYCYLLLPEGRPVTPAAGKRLKAIEDFSDLGAGFQIAMRDLEIRGAGNILGKEQSGHIAVVGYEMYCQLLEQTVRQLRGEAPPLRRDVHVEIGLDALIPTSYVASERQRMEIYRRLVRCAEADELQQIADGIIDAYGPLPAAMRTLLDLAEVRLLAARLGIESILRIEGDLVFSVRDFSRCKDAFRSAAGSVRLVDDHTVYWRPPPAFLQPQSIVNVLLKRLRSGKQTVQ